VIKSVRGIKHPDHVTVVKFTGRDVIGTDRGVLKLDYCATVADYICSMKPYRHLNKLDPDHVLPR